MFFKVFRFIIEQNILKRNFKSYTFCFCEMVYVFYDPAAMDLNQFKTFSNRAHLRANEVVDLSIFRIKYVSDIKKKKKHS